MGANLPKRNIEGNEKKKKKKKRSNKNRDCKKLNLWKRAPLEQTPNDAPFQFILQCIFTLNFDFFFFFFFFFFCTLRTLLKV